MTEGADPNDPVAYDYGDHVDHLIATAKRKGIVMGVIPAWHDHYLEGWITHDKAHDYRRFLGKRLGHHPNLLWVLGGDTDPAKYSQGFDLHRELAAGIRETDTGPHLMTFHPRGGRSSSRYFHEDDWVVLPSRCTVGE